MSFSAGLEVTDNSDTNFAYIWNSLYLAIRGNLVISGCEVVPNSPADLYVDVGSGFVWCAGAKRTVAATSNLDLTSQQGALTSGQSQYIMILWDQATTDVISLDGVAGSTGNIYPPAFDDDSQILLGLVILTYGDTTIDASDIDDIRLFSQDGAYLDGDLEVTGTFDAGGNSTIGGTLDVGGATSFDGDISLGDAYDLIFNRGAYKNTLLVDALTTNRVITIPNGSGKMALTSDGNYQAYSETEIDALLLSHTHDARYYTETEMEALLFIGSDNTFYQSVTIETSNLALEPVTVGSIISGFLVQETGTGARIVFNAPCPFMVGSKTLKITEAGVYVVGATGTNKIVGIKIAAIDGATEAVSAHSVTWDSAGAKTVTPSGVTVSATTKAIKLVLEVSVANIGVLKVSYVYIKGYYS